MLDGWYKSPTLMTEIGHGFSGWLEPLPCMLGFGLHCKTWVFQFSTSLVSWQAFERKTYLASI